MAIFDPDLPEVGADYTGAAKGVRPDTSKAGLFSDVAEIGGAAIKGINDLFKTAIREEATAGVDAIRDREINMGAQQAGYGTQVPSEINTAANRLATMRNAKNAGQVGDSHYFLVLDAEARRLRSRYPGHREYVDNVIQDLTGTNPANHAISMMKTELSKEGKDTQRDEALRWARDKGNEAIVNAMADGRIATTSTEVIQASNAKWGLHLAKIDQAKTQLDLSEKDRTVTQHKLEDMARRDLFGRQIISDGTSLSLDGVDDKALQEAGRRYMEEQKRPGGASSEAFKQLNAALLDYKKKATEGFEAGLNRIQTDSKGKTFRYSGELSHAAVAGMRKDFDAMIDQRVKIYSDGNVAAMAQDTSLIKAMKNEEILKVYTSRPYQLRSEVHREIMGGEAFTFFTRRSPAYVDEESDFIKNHILQGVGNRGTIDDSLKENSEMGRKITSDNDKKVVQAQRHAIEGIAKSLEAGDFNKDPKKVGEIVKYLFGDEKNTTFYRDVKEPDLQDKLYNGLVNQGIADAVQSTKDQKTIARYNSWADQAATVRTMATSQDLAKTFNGDIERGQTDRRFIMVFNEMDSRFIVHDRSTTERGPWDGMGPEADRANKMHLTTKADALNKTITGIRTVREANGDQDYLNQWINDRITRSGLQILPDGRVASNQEQIKPATVKQFTGQSEEQPAPEKTSGTSSQPKTSLPTRGFKTTTTPATGEDTLSSKDRNVSVENPLGVRPEIKQRMDKMRKDMKGWTDEQWDNFTKRGVVR